MDAKASSDGAEANVLEKTSRRSPGVPEGAFAAAAAARESPSAADAWTDLQGRWKRERKEPRDDGALEYLRAAADAAADVDEVLEAPRDCADAFAGVDGVFEVESWMDAALGTLLLVLPVLEDVGACLEVAEKEVLLLQRRRQPSKPA